MVVPTTFAERRSHLNDRQPWRYRDSTGGSTYHRDEGMLVIPVMGAVGTAPVVARVHAPVGYRSARFSAAKVGVPPLFPAQADTDSGDQILSSTLTFPIPVALQTGDLMFGVQGEYTFVQPDGGRSTEDTFPMDKYPYQTMIDRIEELPPPAGNADQDMNWHWNVRYYDARLLCTYDMLT